MTAKDWLESKDRDYRTGVEIYNKHPSAQRGLIATFNKKENKYTTEKLEAVLQKAATMDGNGVAEALKKKEADNTPKKPKAKAKKKATSQPKKKQ